MPRIETRADFTPKQPAKRRLPRPWSVVPGDAGPRVVDANGVTLFISPATHDRNEFPDLLSIEEAQGVSNFTVRAINEYEVPTSPRQETSSTRPSRHRDIAHGRGRVQYGGPLQGSN